LAFIKQHYLQHVFFSRLFKPIKAVGKKIFGDTNQKIRSGNWYGNDTLWRMVLDLNKVMFYVNPDGSLRDDEPQTRKKYIGIVDGILGGEGNGPMAPDPVKSNVIIMGTDPVSIDAVAARTMGFDPMKIPSIANAFKINRYKITDVSYNDIEINVGNQKYAIASIPENLITRYRPHFGWENHIEW